MCCVQEINSTTKVNITIRIGSVLQERNCHRYYEMKCITGVLLNKIGQQLIVGKYGTSSICSTRTICEILPRFYHVFAETCNYRILFYSVSDYIKQRKIINQ